MPKSFLPLALIQLLYLTTSGTVSAQLPRDQSASSNRLFGHPSVEKAWQIAVAKRKPLLVMFTSEHCAYCTKMLSQTYNHPFIRNLLTSKAESVLAHAEDYDTLIKRLGIRGFPTTLVVSPQGQVLDVMEGYLDPEAFAKRINPLLTKQTNQFGNTAAGFAEMKATER